MGLQPILDKIRAVGDAQVREIEKNAQIHASAPAVAERARIIHRARLDALHIVGSVRENLVDTAISRTREHLAALRSDSTYPKVLRALTADALTQLTSSEGDGNFQLLADPRDRALMENILKDLSLNIPIQYQYFTKTTLESGGLPPGFLSKQ